MDFFALDIGFKTTKIIKLKKSGNQKYKLIAAHIIPTPIGGMAGDSDTNLQAVAQAIKQATAEIGINSKYVCNSLPESDVFTRIINMPKMSESELKSAITWEAEQAIPLPLDEVNYSYTIAETKEDGSMSVMVIAAPKRLVHKYETMFAMAKLTPIALETNLVATTRALISNPAQPTTLLLIVGARTTEIGIIKAGNLVFTRSIVTAGEAFTRALVAGFQLEVAQAEQYKRTYGLLPNQFEGKVAEALKPVVNILIKEIKRTINYYQTQSKGEKIATIMLTGGGASLPDLPGYLAKELNLEVQIGDPFQLIETKHPFTAEVVPSFSTAIGLAMKDL